MKYNSIRDLNKNIIITNTTTNLINTKIDYDLFYGNDCIIDTKISIGELLLLRSVNCILENNHNCNICIGYKNI